MAYHTGSKLAAYTGLAFLGGITLGALIGRENRARFGQNAGQIARWVEERSRDTREATGQTYNKMKKQAEKNIPRNWERVLETARQSLTR